MAKEYTTRFALVITSMAVRDNITEGDSYCLCIVASHDIELTEILKNEYDNYHFCEQITNDGIHFDYKLKQGASQTSNAIKLLHYMNFDNSVVENAENLVGKFISTKKW